MRRVLSWRAFTLQAFVLTASIGYADSSSIQVTLGLNSEKQLHQALDSAHEEMQKGKTDDIVIEIGNGEIHFSTPLSIYGLSYHNPDGWLIFRAAPGAKPVFSGGSHIGPWEPDENGRWRISNAQQKSVVNIGAQGGPWPFPVQVFRHLFVNGKRAQRAHSKISEGIERYGDLRVIDRDAGFLLPASDMPKWRNPADIEVGFTNSWSHMFGRISAIVADKDGKTQIQMQQPNFMLISRKEGAQAQLPDYFENAFELLDEPGEYYYEKASDTLFYVPRPGEDMSKADCVVPRLWTLLDFGSDGKSVEVPPHNIRFEGITFADVDGPPLPAGGHADVQANFTISPENLYERDGSLVNVHNEYVKSPGCIRICSGAYNIVFDHCTFTRMGAAALDIDGPQKPGEPGAHDIVIKDCEFYDISGSAIQIGDVTRENHHPHDPVSIVKNNRVENCKIHDIGVEYEDSVGIFAGYTEGTVIEGNEIYNLPYSGISIGWGWGEEDAGGSTYPIPYIFETPTPCKNNRIANNHIHHVMLKRQDGGGVYTLGNMPGTVIEGNHIHDNPGIPGGIYLDEGSGFIEVRNNKVYNVPTPMNFNNRNQNRIDTCNVHDNEFEEKK